MKAILIPFLSGATLLPGLPLPDGVDGLTEVEDYINGIDDPEIKEIFELHYLEGKTQQKVADEIGYTQARVSQIISGQLKDL